MHRRERAALDAVAKRFKASWEKRGNRTVFSIAGKKIDVDFADIRPRGVSNAKPRLRFDKVVISVMTRLQTAAKGAVPDGLTVLVTLTAPIRLAAKTTAVIERHMSSLLARKPGKDIAVAIHGNRFRLRLIKSRRGAPKLIGFVHNPETDAALLLDLTRDLSALANGGRGRWLVIACPGGIAQLDACRHVLAQLRLPAGYRRVVMVFGDGGIGAL